MLTSGCVIQSILCGVEIVPFVGDANAFAARALTTAGHGAFLHPTNFDKDKSKRESISRGKTTRASHLMSVVTQDM